MGLFFFLMNKSVWPLCLSAKCLFGSSCPQLFNTFSTMTIPNTSCQLFFKMQQFIYYVRLVRLLNFRFKKNSIMWIICMITKICGLYFCYSICSIFSTLTLHFKITAWFSIIKKKYNVPLKTMYSLFYIYF